jgi:glutaryl-CoA dehydrogenase
VGGRLSRPRPSSRPRESDVDDLKFGIGDALGTDYFLLKEQMTPQQLDYLRRTREFVDHEVLPVINGY